MEIKYKRQCDLHLHLAFEQKWGMKGNAQSLGITDNCELWLALAVIYKSSNWMCMVEILYMADTLSLVISVEENQVTFLCLPLPLEFDNL